jgi:hypothetical protein
VERSSLEIWARSEAQRTSRKSSRRDGTCNGEGASCLEQFRSSGQAMVPHSLSSVTQVGIRAGAVTVGDGLSSNIRCTAEIIALLSGLQRHSPVAELAPHRARR